MTKVTLQADLTGPSTDLDTVQGAIAPEHAEEFPGATVTMDRPAPDRLALTITGERLPPVRAATNALLGWVHTVEDVLEVARPHEDDPHG
ncbi:MAG: hypothetical protein R3185_04945 [Candidatus Thermoplasmatota archaeon]|nr:hypothetical protein [Candidatus Thermoplasmatota archaeon]